MAVSFRRRLLVTTALAGVVATTASMGAAGVSAATFDVGDEAGLVSAINAVNAGSDASNTINITNDIGLTGSTMLPAGLPDIDIGGRALTINGNDFSIDGNNGYSIIRADSGALAINDLAIMNGVAQGAPGQSGALGAGGGDGLGAGGGLFVGADASVTIMNVSFANNQAIGGNGGNGGESYYSYYGPPVIHAPIPPTAIGGGAGGGFGGGPGGVGGYFGGAPYSEGSDGGFGAGGGGGFVGYQIYYFANPAGNGGAGGFGAGGGGGGGSFNYYFEGPGQLTTGDSVIYTPGYAPGVGGAAGSYSGGGGDGGGPNYGYYAGVYSSGGGGGGAGLGGAVFVRQGGSLTIVGPGAIGGNSAAGGQGGGPGLYAQYAANYYGADVGATGANGTGLGNGLFLMGVTLGVQVPDSMAVNVADSIAGTGGITKTGAGTLNLSAVNVYSGATIVNAGTLSVTGSLLSTVSVGDGGTLAGTGSVGGLMVNGGGSAAPGNSIGTMTIAGNATFGAGSFFDVEVDNTGAGDRLNVTGSASLSGGTVRVLPADTNGDLSLLPIESEFTILSAAGGLGSTQFAGLELLFPNFFGALRTENDSDVILSLVKRTLALFDGTVAGRTQNQSEVANAFLEIENNPAFEELVAALFNTVSTEAELQKILDNLSTEHLAAVRTLLFSYGHLVDTNIRNRLLRVFEGSGAAGAGPSLLSFGGGDLLDAAPVLAQSGTATYTLGGGAAGDELPGPVTLWLSGLGTFGNVDSDGNGGEFDFSVGGFVAGAEVPLGEEAIAGIALSYAAGETEADDGLAETDADILRMTAYTGVGGGLVDVRGGVSYGYYDVDGTRRVVVGGFNRTAASQFKIREVSVFAEAGKTFFVGGHAIEPLASFGVTRLRQDAFTETGAGPANLRAEEKTTVSAPMSFGARIARPFVAGGTWTVVPEARLRLIHEFGEVERINDFTFASAAAGGQFVAEASTADRNTGLFGIGFTASDGSNLAFELQYNAEVGDRLTAHSVTGGVCIVW